MPLLIPLTITYDPITRHTIAMAYYPAPNSRPHQVCLRVGDAIMHSGSMRHGGRPVRRGVPRLSVT